MIDRPLTTNCPLDCPDSCALEVSVVDGRVAKIHGSPHHPVTAGFICSKVSRFAERLSHETRVLYPLRRSGAKGSGAFSRISWDEAIEEIAARFRGIAAEWGGEALLPYHYGGSNGYLTDGFLDQLFFARLGASRLGRTICAAPATAVAVGMYGKMPGVAFQDYVDAKCIIVWGANPKASNIHLVPFLREAKRRGAFVAVVDPIRNFSSNEVDLHLPVRPGTDLPVALGIIEELRAAGYVDEGFVRAHVRSAAPLLEAAGAWPIARAAAEAGVSVDQLRQLAHVYAETSPAVIRCGWGVERNRNGGQALAAILSLPALMGKFGLRGGGYTLSNGGAATFEHDQLFDVRSWDTRVINMTQLGSVLTEPLDPPIKGLFVYNANPVATVPDQNTILQGLGREALFTVVHDQVMTDSAAFADIVLPATTFLEHWDVRVSYGNYSVAGVRPAVPAAGEARSNPDVFGALGRAMGFSDPAFQWDAETCFRKVAEAIRLNGNAAQPDLLAQGRSQAYGFPEATPIQFGTVFPRTADGKVDLCPAVLGESPYEYRRLQGNDYPLALISPATTKMISSTLGEFNFGRLCVLIHPDDASRRGIETGGPVRIFNDLGEVVCRAVVSPRVRSGVVSLPKGAWRQSSENGMTATALCPSHVNEVAGGACFNDARVEVERLV